MVVGYVRLSKDDNKRDYVSIENQKLILTQYANQNGYQIERWYEDDGVSGYTFERPAFLQMRLDLERDIDLILAKDLSRIGRHNARVLLFLEEVKERGKRIILTDDAYDSWLEEDDTIGIKTWYNERYVKDTSKKIKKAMRARQFEGTLAVKTPMGYRRNPVDKSIIEIDEEAAPYIRRIFSLYLEGYGFRAIAGIIDKEGIPTASKLEKEHQEAVGKCYRKKVAHHWSAKMIGDIIKNDIYIGNMRYHKNERLSVHGKDFHVDKQDHYLFLEHHPPIIDKEIFENAQRILSKRVKISYRGQGKNRNKYSGLILCKTCGSKFTSIQRKGKDKYYICGTYNTKGKLFCNQSIRVKEKELDDMIRFCRIQLLYQYSDYVDSIYYEREQIQTNCLTQSFNQLERTLAKEQEELKLILIQTARIPMLHHETSIIMEEAYHTLISEKVEKINQLKTKIEKYNELKEQKKLKELKERNNRKELNDIDERNVISERKEENQTYKECEMKSKDITIIKELEEKDVSRQEIEALIEHIIIAKDGSIEIQLKDKITELPFCHSV